MSTPHQSIAEPSEQPVDQPHDEHGGRQADHNWLSQSENAPTEPISSTPSGPNPPFPPYPPAGAQSSAYPAPTNDSNGVSDKLRNAVIAGGIGVAVVFAGLGFGAGYVVGDSSSSDQGPGMNMQGGGRMGPGGQGGFGQMPPGQSGGTGQVPGQGGMGQMPQGGLRQMPGQTQQGQGQSGQLPGESGQTAPNQTTQGSSGA